MRSSSPATLQRVLDIVADATVVLLALLGSLLAVDGVSWASLAVLLAMVVLGAQMLRTRRGREGTWNPFGRSLVLRTATVVATSVCLARAVPGSGQAVTATLGAAVLVGALVVEPFVARAARYVVPAAVRLPGVPSRRTLPNLGPVSVLLSVVASVLGLLLAAAGADAWWWVLIGLLAVAPVVVLTVDGRAKIVFARRRRALVPHAVAAYAPDFMVYTSRPDDASYQVMMWLPYLKRAGLRFIIVTRNAAPAAALAELTDVPVVEARGIRDVDALVVPSLKAAFYVNASSGNGALVRFQHLTHVYLGHGDSDKPPSYNPTHAMYDQIFAAGAAATRRYAAHGVRIPAEKFRIVGRPQVEQVQQTITPMASISQPTVLYAPTWRGHVEETMLYSLPSGEQIVSALLQRGATVIFRPHPFSYDFEEDAGSITRIAALLEADARSSGRQHLWGAAAEKDRGILDCINASDAMVSDVSSVVSDYLFSGKPFAMIAVPSEPEAFVEEFPVARASYVVRGDLADLDARLDEMLGADPLAARRVGIRVDYLGDFPPDRYSDAFVDAVHQASVGSTGKDDHLDEEGESGSPESRDGADDDADTDKGRDWSRYLSAARRVGLELAGAGLALMTLAVALVGGVGWLAALTATLSVLAVFASQWQNVRRRVDWPRLLAAGEEARTVLLFALVLAALDQPERRLEYALGAALLLVVLVIERRTRSAWGAGVLVRNLPAAFVEISEVIPRGVLPLVGATATVAGFVLAWLAAPGVLVVVLGAVVLAAAVEVTVRSLRRAGEATLAEPRLRAALEAYGPKFVVYFASTVGAQYQVGMWLDYFVRIDRPFVIVSRTAPMLRQIAALCEERSVVVPLIYRRTLRSVEEVVVDSMSTAFYVNNAPRNTHLVERRELTHVWLNHGDSEKPACFNPVHAIYDLIFAAGQAGIDRYARHGVSIPREKFVIVGRPQVELIVPAAGPIADAERPTVLYAPTWQGPFADSRVYSLPVGRQIVEELMSRGARVIFRAHPFNYRYPEARAMIADIGATLDADRPRSGLAHLWGPPAEVEMTIEDCFNASDAMISDVSAVVSDYLHANKPFAMVSVGREPEQLAVDAPAAKAAYVLREDLSNLSEVCDLLLGGDPLRDLRKQTKIYYLGDFPEHNYAEGFLSAARRVIDAGPHARFGR